METYIDDIDIGRIRIKSSSRAKHYSLKITDGNVYGIMPFGGSIEIMENFIISKKHKIISALARHPSKPIIDERTDMQTATFKVCIIRGDKNNFYASLDNGILMIICPSDTCFENESTQKKLKNIIVCALRHEAKRVLPTRLQELAKAHNFKFAQAKVNSSRTHWGSCTARKNINLSLYLMQLPWHLIDYVLLHELCHTIEMNHSEHFWKLMDRVTDGKARSLRSEIKGFNML